MYIYTHTIPALACDRYSGLEQDEWSCFKQEPVQLVLCLTLRQFELKFGSKLNLKIKIEEKINKLN